MTEEKETKKEEPKQEGFTLVQVPTEHRLAIQTPEGELMSTEQGIVKILNDLAEMKKGVLG